MVLIIDIQYFPSVIYYKTLYNITNISFEQYEISRKMSFRNRCLIAGANGIITLSVPMMEGRDRKRIMKDIRVDNSRAWQSQHFKSIVSAYGRSPWFGHYVDALQELYRRPYIYLLDWNLACFEWTIRQLDLSLNISLTERYIPTSQSYGQIDRRNQYIPKNYLDWEPVRYSQVFQEKHGFLPNLSILDLIFCEGKNAKNKLWGRP